MRALGVLHNRVLFCVAGAPHLQWLFVTLDGDVEGPEPARLSVMGTTASPDYPMSHIYWAESLALEDRDEVTIRLVDTDGPSPPKREQTDHVWYEENKNLPQRARELVRVHMQLRFAMSLNGVSVAEARLEADREYISFSTGWNYRRPDEFSASLCSFSAQEAVRKKLAHGWTTLKLGPDDFVNVRVSF